MTILLFAAGATAGILGCTRRVEIQVASITMVDAVQGDGGTRVHPASAQPPPEGWKERPKIAVLLSSAEDLNRIAEETRVNYVYYELYRCGSDPASKRILGGEVYMSSAKAQSRVDERVGLRDEYLYTVYIPSEVAALIQYSNVAAEPELKVEIAMLKNDGMCVRIGGYRMLKTGMISNEIRVSVEEVNGKLTAVAASPRHAT